MNPPPRKDEVVVTNPDPTAAVKEALELAIRNLDDKIDRRFQGIDSATTLAREELREKLSDLKEGIQASADAERAANKDLVEKLERVGQAALSAALLTQKESAAKSELAMADQLRQLQNAFEAANKATNEKIDRLTSRLDMGEGRTGGVDANRSDHRNSTLDTRSLVFALISVILIAAGIIVSIEMRR